MKFKYNCFGRNAKSILYRFYPLLQNTTDKQHKQICSTWYCDLLKRLFINKHIYKEVSQDFIFSFMIKTTYYLN